MSETSRSPRPWKDVWLVVLGAVLALPAAFVGGLLSQANDQQAFLRQERAAAYESYLGSLADLDGEIERVVLANSVDDEGDAPEPSREQREVPVELLEALEDSFNRVQIIGSPDALAAAENALRMHRLYEQFLSERLSDLYESSGGYSEYASDWFYEGGADFMAISAECLRVEGRLPYVQAVQADLGVGTSAQAESLDVPDETCDLVDWTDLRAGYSDAVSAGSFG